MGNVDIWNMNQEYLFMILALMKKYTEAKFEKDWDTMYECLESMESTLFPAVEKDDVEDSLKKIEENISRMEKRNEIGEVIWYKPELVRQTRKLMNETYSKLLVKMEKHGMLVQQKKDPKTAMGNFGGS